MNRSENIFGYARFLLLCIGWLVLMAPGAWAASQRANHTTFDIVSEHSSLPRDGGEVTLGFQIKPDPNWHLYWLNPGEAGQQARIKWELPAGFSVTELKFPTPHLIPFGDLNTYGFEEPVILLSTLKVPAIQGSNENLTLTGRASWVVCDDRICVPEKAGISLTLPVGDGAANPSLVSHFTNARAALPRAVTWPAKMDVQNDRLSASISLPENAGDIEDPYLFISERGLVKYDSQVSRLTSSSIHFTMDAGKKAAEIQTSDAVLSYISAAGEPQAVILKMAKAPIALGVAPGPGDSGGLSLPGAILFAFIGGLILNLMPCVFPILSMKALGLVKMAHADRKSVRESGLLYTAGIAVTFLVIACILIGLRSAGQAVGWGFQMQSPLMNFIFGLLLVAISLNLFGIFEFGSSIPGVGQKYTQGSERRSAFFTGLLAVIVATPCTAPFMAGALVFVLAQPIYMALIVCLALGLGLAFPYLLLSFVPGLSKMLPGPGAWMVTFKSVLGFPMMITALWMFWLIGRQLGVDSMSVAILSAILFGVALWAYGKRAFASRKFGWGFSAILALVVSLAMGTQIQTLATDTRQWVAKSGASLKLGSLDVENFTPERVANYVTSGQPLFVYFTADWCISCKVNEKIALSTKGVATAFKKRGIKVIEGDWTSENPVITEWLARYDRVGVPLYLYFPKGTSLDSPVILPQILLPKIVIDAVREADSRAEVSKNDIGSTPERKKRDYNADVPIPEVAPDWSVIQSYIDVDTVWHQVDNEIRSADISKEEKEARFKNERGEHPDITDAIAAATAIVKTGDVQPKLFDAAEFLMDHTIGDENQYQHMELGARTIARHFPQHENLPLMLWQLDFYTAVGERDSVEVFFAEMAENAATPHFRATARYYAASRALRLVNTIGTPKDVRDVQRKQALTFATGLSQGVGNMDLQRPKRRSQTGGGRKIPTMAEAEKNLIYTINSMSVGNRIPEVFAQNLVGNDESIRKYEGQTVLLDFWATWCGPCIASLPKMRELDEGLPEDAFEILSISVDEEIETVIDFQIEQPMEWANWHVGPQAELLQTWVVRGYPTYILVDPEGTILARTTGLDKKFFEFVKSAACKGGDTNIRRC